MIRWARYALAAFVGVLTAVACANTRDLPVRVESLEGSLPTLTEAGRRWRPDAYLETATLRLLDDRPSGHTLSAKFNSPSEKFQSIAVRQQSDGSISVETFPQSVPVIQVEPIESDDWTIDSEEALEIGLDSQALRLLEQQQSVECSFLSLERSGLNPQSPVVWRLVLSDCLDPWTGLTTVIDANSGQILSREAHAPPAP